MEEKNKGTFLDEASKADVIAIKCHYIEKEHYT